MRRRCRHSSHSLEEVSKGARIIDSQFIHLKCFLVQRTDCCSNTQKFLLHFTKLP